MKHVVKKQKIMEYIAVFQEEKEGEYSVWVPELPGCASQGETIEKAMKNIREAIELYLEDNNQASKEDNNYKKQFVVPIQINYA